MKYTFGDIVIIESNLIGVIVKCWGKPLNRPKSETERKYEVYVRNFNAIVEYEESKIERYLVRHKELSDEELEWQYNAMQD